MYQQNNDTGVKQTYYTDCTQEVSVSEWNEDEPPCNNHCISVPTRTLTENLLFYQQAVYQHTSRYKTAIFNYNIMTSRDRTRTLLPKIGTQTVHVWNLWIQNAMQFFQLVCITGHEPMTIVWDTTGISYPTLKTILVFILRMRVCGIYG